MPLVILIATILVGTVLVHAGMPISELAILFVLVTIVFIIFTSMMKIIANRKEANTLTRLREAHWEVFAQGMAELEATRKLFLTRKNDLSQEDQTSLWAPIADTQMSAFDFLLGHNSVRASICLAEAKAKADSLIAQYQEA
jgi:hypothetical protein